MYQMFLIWANVCGVRLSLTIRKSEAIGGAYCAELANVGGMRLQEQLRRTLLCSCGRTQKPV